MNKRGEHIPTAWLIVIPIVGWAWWLWLYSKGVEHVTGGKMSGVEAFLLLFLLAMIGQAIVQDTFNAVGEGSGSPVSTPQFAANPVRRGHTIYTANCRPYASDAHPAYSTDNAAISYPTGKPAFR